MAESPSYFPPENYWPPSKSAYPLRIQPEPLLPTPVSSCGLASFIEDVEDISPYNTRTSATSECSCPTSDLCIAETLGLLLGSAKLLHVAAEWHPSAFEGLSAYLADEETSPFFLDLSAALSQLEDCLHKILSKAPYLSSTDATLTLLRQWRCPTRTNVEGVDVCASIRAQLNYLEIVSVDTFPPIQHVIHMLLAWYDFSDAQFQTRLDALESTESSPAVKLLLEANKSLAQFSVKPSSHGRNEMVAELRTKVDDFVRDAKLDMTAK